MKMKLRSSLEWLYDVSGVIDTGEGMKPVFSVTPVTEEAEAIKSTAQCIKALSPLREELERIYGETHSKAYIILISL